MSCNHHAAFGEADTFTLEAYRRSLREVRCEGCNVRFLPRRKGQRFCGDRCRKRIEQRRYRQNPEEAAVLRHVADRRQRGDVYLIPASFPKLKAGARGSVSLTFTPPPSFDGSTISGDCELCHKQLESQP